MSINNYLIFFDYDFTITSSDSFFRLFPFFKTDEIKAKIFKHKQNLEWAELYQTAIDELNKLGITLDKINTIFSEAKLTPGMFELFNYIKQNKEKFLAYVLTSNIKILVNSYFESKNIKDVFCDIIGFEAQESPNKDTLVLTEYDKEGKINCDLCAKNVCKGFEAKKIIEKNKEKNLKKTLFVCDGWNDFCLARELGQNDVLFVRKGFELYKKLFDEGLKDKLKCEIVCWESGEEIKNYLEKLN